MGSARQSWPGSEVWAYFELFSWDLRKSSTYDTLEMAGRMHGSLCSF